MEHEAIGTEFFPEHSRTFSWGVHCLGGIGWAIPVAKVSGDSLNGGRGQWQGIGKQEIGTGCSPNLLFLFYHLAILPL